jgi:hypothetical protein
VRLLAASFVLYSLSGEPSCPPHLLKRRLGRSRLCLRNYWFYCRCRICLLYRNLLVCRLRRCRLFNQTFCLHVLLRTLGAFVARNLYHLTLCLR